MSARQRKRSRSVLERYRPELVIIAAALAVNLLLLLLYYLPEAKLIIGDEKYYLNHAARLRVGQDGSWLYPYWPPLYAHLISWLFFLFGVKLLPVQLAQVAMWLGSGLLWYLIAERMSASRLVARVTLAGLFFCPDLMGFSHYLWPETVHLFLFSLALWLLARRPLTAWTAMAAGALLGSCLATKLLLLYFLPVILFFAWVNSDQAPRRKLALVGLAAAALVVAVLPWLALNKRTYGSYLLGDSGYLVVWQGLNCLDRPEYAADGRGLMSHEYRNCADDFQGRHAVFRAKLLGLVREEGVASLLWDQLSKQYTRLFGHRTLFTMQLPGGEREAYRFKARRLATFLRAWSYSYYALLLALAVCGMLLVRLRGWDWWAFCYVFLLYNLSLYLFAYSVARRRVQFLPLLVLFAATAVYWGWRRFRGGAKRDELVRLYPEPDRVKAALAIIVLLEFIAFAWA